MKSGKGSCPPFSFRPVYGGGKNGRTGNTWHTCGRRGVRPLPGTTPDRRQGALLVRRTISREVVTLQPNLLSTRQVAELLGVSRQYVRKLVQAGCLTPALPVTAGQSMWFRTEDVEALLRARQGKRTARRPRLSGDNLREG
ncbi:MAG: helix-turn-helix domain-containing protein [Limnochordaceae bacterium]|nr:helix-turn-helix domain-containing protein [Limnochordaceae bacterium]